ncbi:MFS transporter [Patescibacteria group bacterium]|nr:MFS transporter [Patescibacteria group bacterium]
MQMIKANIWKLYTIISMQETLLFIGVLYPFLQSNGITIAQYFVLQGFFALFIVLLEIPSGYLSDRWGRKNTLILGSICGCVGVFTYAFSTHFLHFLVGESFMALAFSCYSGTTEAMFFDTLLVLGKEKYYRKIAGNFLSFRFVANALGAIASGIIATTWSLRATMWCTAPFMIGALIVSLMLIEPSRHKLQESRHVKAMLYIVVQTLNHNTPLKSIILLSTTISAMTFALVWFTQPYQTLIEFPLSIFGVPHAIALLLGAALSQIIPRLERKVDDRLLLIGIVATVVTSYFLLGYLVSIIGLAVIIIGRTAYGALMPVTSDLINRMTTSDVRATVLSIRSLGEKLLFAVASPFLGYIADIYTLNQAILFSGIFGGVVAVFLLFRMKYVWKQIPA